MGTARVEFMLKLPIKLVKKKKYYLASCPVLDVFTQGENKKRAKENLAEALSLFLITCFEEGTLDDVLRSCGFRPAKRKLKTISKPQDYLNIPIPLIVSQEAKACHA